MILQKSFFMSYRYLLVKGFAWRNTGLLHTSTISTLLLFIGDMMPTIGYMNNVKLTYRKNHSFAKILRL